MSLTGKITRRISIALIIICVITVVYYVWRGPVHEPAGPSGPVPFVRPGVMYGVRITKQAGGSTMTLKAATLRPRAAAQSPNLIEHLMKGSSGYKLELRRVDMSIRGEGRLLELKSEKAYANEDFMDIRFKGLKITANEGYDLHPGITGLRVTVMDGSIEVTPAR